MPAKAYRINSDELYEAIRNANGVPFTFVTGGVKYKAVLEHKETREHRAATQASSAASTEISPRTSQESLREPKKH